MKTNAGLTITRPSYGDGRNKISITVKDRDSVTRFLDLEIDYDKFTECLTGLAEVDCEITTRNLERVGKQREIDSIKFEVPKGRENTTEEELYSLAEEATPKGWICSHYFRSQDSFVYHDDKTYARTSISRWIEKD